MEREIEKQEDRNKKMDMSQTKEDILYQGIFFSLIMTLRKIIHLKKIGVT